MRPLILLACCLALLTAAAAESAPLTPVVDDAGVLRNVSSFADAPELPESEPLRLRLAVRNPYDRAVQVKLIDKTCTCLELDVASRFLLPDETTSLSAVVDNRNRSGDVRMGVTLYLSEPEFAPIEVELLWRVRPHIAVDAVPPGADPAVRPDAAWRDVYRYVANERPDEPNRLRKRIRLSCGAGEAPAEGLRVTAIDYPGSVWAFGQQTQADGSVLITGRAAGTTLPVGEFDEQVLVRTNHPQKSEIRLSFLTVINPTAGAEPIDPATTRVEPAAATPQPTPAPVPTATPAPASASPAPTAPPAPPTARPARTSPTTVLIWCGLSVVALVVLALLRRRRR
jgi:hypothetical protein